MKTFNQFNAEQEDIQTALLSLSYMLEQYDNKSLNESHEVLEEGLNDMLKKFGMHVHKGDGLIQYITKFTKGAGQMILAAIKGDKAKVKQIAQSVTKEQVIDFFLKLDTATMHLVSGPLHTIDAVTGWHIWAHVEAAAKKASSIMDQIKKLYNDLKTKAKVAFKKAPEKIKAIDNLEPIISYSK